jgi:hypothetical protein
MEILLDVKDNARIGKWKDLITELGYEPVIFNRNYDKSVTCGNGAFLCAIEKARSHHDRWGIIAIVHESEYGIKKIGEIEQIPKLKLDRDNLSLVRDLIKKGVEVYQEEVLVIINLRRESSVFTYQVSTQFPVTGSESEYIYNIDTYMNILFHDKVSEYEQVEKTFINRKVSEVVKREEHKVKVKMY